MASENIDIESRIGSTGLLAGVTSLPVSALIFAGLAIALTSFPVWPVSVVAYAQGFTYPVWGCFILACGVGTAVSTKFWYRLRIPDAARSGEVEIAWLAFGIVSLFVATASVLRLLTTMAILLILLVAIFVVPIMLLYGVVKIDGGTVLLSIVLLVLLVVAAQPIGYHENPLTIDQTAILYNFLITAAIVGLVPLGVIEDSTDDTVDLDQRSGPDVTIEHEPAPTAPSSSSETSPSDDMFTHIDEIDDACSRALVEAGFSSVEELQQAEEVAIADAIDVAPAGGRVSQINAAIEELADGPKSNQNTAIPSNVETEAAPTTDADSSVGKGTGGSTEELEDREPDVERDKERTELLETIQSLYKSLDRVPKTTDLAEHSKFNRNGWLSEFDTWDAALKAAGIDIEAEYLTELRRLAKELGKEPTSTEMDNYGKYSSSQYSIQFGSWDAALKQADVSDVVDSEATTEGATGVGAPDAVGEVSAGSLSESTEEETASSSSGDDRTDTSPSREALLDEVNRLNDATPGLLKASHMRDRGAHSVHEYTNEFGSWDEAMAEAGIDKQAQLVAEVEHVWEQLGHRPSTTEMNKHGRVSATTISNYFDSWDNVCKRAAPDLTASDESKREYADDIFDVSEILTWREIVDNSRLAGPYLAQVEKNISIRDDNREATLRTSDIRGRGCRIELWRKHDARTDFESGNWYLFSELRGTVWEDSDGSLRKQLSSTRDMEVTEVTGDVAAETLLREAETRGLLPETESESGEVSQELNKERSQTSSSESASSSHEEKNPGSDGDGDDTEGPDDLVDQLLGDMDL